MHKQQIEGDRALSETMALEFVDVEGASTPLEATFEYDASAPYALTIVFGAAQGGVRWTFARDLLLDGFYEPTGDGDVHVWPCLDSSGSAVVILELHAPGGEVLLQSPSRQVAEFNRRLLELVPRGSESQQIDLDSAIAGLFAG